MTHPAIDDPTALSASAGLEAIAAGRLTPGRWIEACHARIAEREPAVHAWAHIAETAAPAGVGPLGGLPVGVKDVIDVRGQPTGCNSPIEQGRIAVRSADAVARLEQAGAVVIGKTVTTEYAFLEPGPTRHPLDPARTPGGSSSGSAAAVADRHVPVALTTQTGGSTIRPAAYCGIVGYKPPLGHVPTGGLRLLAPSLDVIGIHARTVEDVARVASVLEGRARDGRLDGPPPTFLRVRLPGEEQAEPCVEAMMEAALEALAARGARVEACETPTELEPLDPAHRTIMAAEVARSFRAVYARNREQLSASLRAFMERGQGESDDDLASAHAAVARARHWLLGRACAGSVLICPAATGEAPVGLRSTGSAVFSRLWSLLGLGAASVPSGLGPAGMPLGLQLVDPAPAAARLLPAAAFAEAALALEKTRRFGRPS